MTLSSFIFITWVGLVADASLTWLIERYSLRSFAAAKFQHTDKVQYYGSHGLRYLGLFFSIDL
jgi:uncharacterized membrane protein YdjX (TVP38/TMEM64 family)